MGVRYANITLQGVSQDELVVYLSGVHLDAYVAPNFNGYTVLYDVASIGYPSEIPKTIQLETNLRALWHQYQDGQQTAMVCLSAHLSKRFDCPVLAVFAIDSLTLWYHLAQHGRMLDEYVTHGNKDWQPGRALGDTAKGNVEGGDARKLCRAFGQEAAVTEVETILRKSAGSVRLDIDPPRDNQTLLQAQCFDSMTRHEALARALGIRPCWVVGMNYLCCTGEDDFEAHYGDNREESDPTFEEAITLVRGTLPKVGGRCL